MIKTNNPIGMINSMGTINPWKTITINEAEILVLATAYDALKKLSPNASDTTIYFTLKTLDFKSFIYKTLEELAAGKLAAKK